MITLKALKADTNVNISEMTFEGYCAVFSNVDEVGDVLQPGSCTKTIQERFAKKEIKGLWLHSEPLGMPLEMYADDKGVYVKAKVTDTTFGRECLEYMKDKVVDRMSIGYDSVKKQYEELQNGGGFIRHLLEIKLYEFSPVLFPANPAAVITGVKTGSGVQWVDKAEYKALMKDQEPATTTLEIYQPHEVASFVESIKQLGEYARQTREKYYA
jgi:HK97 family phage prohead protease